MVLLFDFILLLIFVDVEFTGNLLVFTLQYVDAMSGSVILVLILLNFIFLQLDLFLELSLLVVEFILQSQEMFVKRNTVTEERFIAACLVLLIDFLVLEQLDFSLHDGDLTL